MDKVKVEIYKLDSWGWQCPCGQFNIEVVDPFYLKTVECNECHKEFESWHI